MPFTRLGQTLTAKEIFSLVQQDVEQVEREIGLESISSVEAITFISKYLQESGGKRIRPTLVLLSAKMLSDTTPLATKLAAVVEMVHTATLVHDDVIDESATRRGRASVNAVWGNTVAVLSGDWLYMQAFQVALRERNFKLLDLLIGLTQTMVEGEMLQLEWVGRIDVCEAEYMDLVDRKTASLFRTCSQLGAIAAGQNGAIEAQLGEFAWNLGMAFQLADDILDFTAEETKLGKPVGGDLREGKVTLPLIYALRQGSAEERMMVQTVLDQRSYDGVSLASIRHLIERHAGFDQARERAMGFASKARDILSGFPDNRYQRALHSVIDLVVDRES